MKNKSKFTVLCEQEANHHQLSITTIKKIIKKSGFNAESYMQLVEQAKKNSYKSKKKITSIIMPTSYVLNNIIEGKIHQHRIPEFALHNAEYAYVIEQHHNNLIEELYIDKDGDNVLFHGLKYDEYIIMCALYTYIYKEHNIDKNSIYTTTTVTLQDLYQLLYPNSRWDKMSHAKKMEFLQSVFNAGKKTMKLEGKYYRNGLKKAITDKGYNRFLMLIKPRGNHIDKITIEASCNNDGLLQQAVEQKRILSIKQDIISYGRNTKKNHMLAKIYIAYRILINSEKMQKIITKKTLKYMCGAVDNEWLNNYLQHLVNQKLIKSFENSRHGISWEFEEVKKQKLIIMHDESGAMSENPPPETEDIEAKKQDLITINKFFSRYCVTCNDKIINTALHSTYCNNNWENGGRLYTSAGGYQSLPKEVRKNIKINGKKTIELDFTAYHPSILYAMNEEEVPEDSYDFCDNRKIAKLALNIVINAKNKSEAIGAMKQKCKDMGVDIDCNALIQKIEKRHAKIAHHFYDNVGVVLQWFDSMIAMDIVKQMRAKKIIALPIHDSFIVDVRFAEILKQVMLDVYYSRTGSKKIKIK